MPASRYLEFVYTVLFERTRKAVLSEAEMKPVEDALLRNPDRGDLIAGSGGVRKIRAVQEDRGKRGSARVVYLYVREQETVYFLFAFPKNVQGNLTEAQKKVIRTLVAQIEAEEWPRRMYAS